MLVLRVFLFTVLFTGDFPFHFQWIYGVGRTIAVGLPSDDGGVVLAWLSAVCRTTEAYYNPKSDKSKRQNRKSLIA